MLDKLKLEKSLRLNIKWFEKSGVMDPPDGSWGVGERVLLTEGNEALEKTYEAFPAYTRHGDYSISEHRRPDCCFETALMYLLASEALGERKYYDTAENILTYLYCRSGMRNTASEPHPKGVWRWSNARWLTEIYFDDNAWNCVIPMIIAKLAPDLGVKFDMVNTSLQVASAMEEAFSCQFPEIEVKDGRYVWLGDLKSPHWGSLACMAFAFAFRETGEDKYSKAILKYNDYLDANKDSFTTSEHAYIVIGQSIAAAFLKNRVIEATAMESADRLLSKQDMRTGNIPSEWGKEAPVGEHLVDTIYTQNWVLLGLHTLCALSQDGKYRASFDKATGLLLKIQDRSPEKHLRGCWRGMYDLKTKSWGGGDRFEGGANSIYSGWTNAPISIVAAFELLGKSLIKGEK
ncbi:MAG TPA: hypothetical protein DET40_06965 [Lentisphaeria bacterium]|nr:MAG: hypothetical protein A2X45_07335 [Lentisphaerae bacterium GWF2_50_93]HCE43271.1 hypothetical protein [Lentisphaeria bacterium]